MGRVKKANEGVNICREAENSFARVNIGLMG